MTNYLLIISILIFNYIGSFAQKDYLKIKTMTISHCGDSLIPQKYELDIKSKRVYFITPISNYLDIKGEKYKRCVKLDKKKRGDIFKCVDQINFINLGQTRISDNKHCYYVVDIFYTDNTFYNNTFPDEFLPTDLTKIYNTITEKQ